MWKKLRRPHLLALIGPSGAGKSSFLRAGLIPTIPEGWRVVISTPGNRPFRALAQRLVPEFEGDTEAMTALLDLEEMEVAVPLVALVAGAAQAGPGHRGSVRGAVHPEPAGGAGAVC